MTWLLPWALGAAVAAAIGVTLLHLLARDRPPRWMLPTARFVAPGTARATRRARTPRDLLLLAVRALALLLAGAAFGAPLLHPDGGTVAQVLVLDLGDPRGATAAVDTAQARHRDGDRLVLIDTGITIVAAGMERALLDSLDSLDFVAPAISAAVNAASSNRSPANLAPAARARPTLTAAVVAAVRAAAALPLHADSAALVMIAPSAVHDRALAAARATWPGRGVVVPVSRVMVADSIAPPAVAGRPAVRGATGDPIVAAARLAGAALASAAAPADARGTLITRGEPSASDSAWAAGGGTLLLWPADTAPAWLPRAVQPDTVAGIVVDGRASLFATVRRHAPPPGDVIARWIDGAPAVTEAVHGSGCIRTAVVEVPAAGDVALRPAFQAALQALMRPCSQAHPEPIADSTRALLAGEGPLAIASALRAGTSRSPATPWLLAAALALLVVAEPLVRRRRSAPGDGTAA